MVNKESKTVKEVCKVCGGSGGWKNNDIAHWYNINWNDCLYCEGYGFVNKEKDEDIPFLLAYNGYKKIITDNMEDFGQLISYTTKDKASTVEIGFIPKDRNAFGDFAKKLLKFGHYNTRLDIEIHQLFYYEPAYDRHNYYWRFVLKPTNIMDLDGFVDFIRAWNSVKIKKGGSKLNNG